MNDLYLKTFHYKSSVGQEWFRTRSFVELEEEAGSTCIAMVFARGSSYVILFNPYKKQQRTPGSTFFLVLVLAVLKVPYDSSSNSEDSTNRAACEFPFNVLMYCGLSQGRQTSEKAVGPEEPANLPQTLLAVAREDVESANLGKYPVMEENSGLQKKKDSESC
ncbi:hypothetical protein MG293_006272 [Ovis ammon polii]|uniref:Uncharacterized protein n=1 Tax=Ovis ammon polii TaxID=230172 RepID=A0AAD4YD37_OVIAM|nr:hypothetical protein MG293_006272 [Ovis ammon polii]